MEKMTLKDYVDCIAQNEDKIAYRFLTYGNVTEKTYRKLADDSRKIASWFAKNGVFGKHIAILGSASYDWITAYLGITSSGNVAVPLDKMLPTEEICNLIRMGDVDMMFVSPEFSEKIDEYAKSSEKLTDIIPFESKCFKEIRKTEFAELPEIDENALAELIFRFPVPHGQNGAPLYEKIGKRHI